MKRKRLLRNSVSLICVGVMMIGIAGCGQEKKSGENKTLQVVTDGRLYNTVCYAERFFEGSKEGMEVNVQRLPDDSQKRETEIQKLRTEIMAGKGPDVFLMGPESENVAEDIMQLFENPYQTMQSGALASLDKYMEKDDYWEESTYQKAFLKAGQYNGRQYIIPLSVYYEVYLRTNDMEEMTGNTLDEWLDQAEISDDSRVKSFADDFACMGARWIQPAADYEQGEVLFDQSKWNVFAEKYFQFRSRNDYWDYEIEERNDYGMKTVLDLEIYPEREVQAIPDLNGQKMASIMSYGAVGMSSDRKEEAYEFLMLFLNDQSKQFRNEHPDSILPELQGYLDAANVPVQESAMKAALGYPEETVLTKAIEDFRGLDGAYFLTTAERELSLGALDVFALIEPEPREDIVLKQKEDFSRLSLDAYNTYKMFVTE